jgi:hypothetical protein
MKEKETIFMIDVMGALLLFGGVLRLRTYLQRRPWPVVEASFQLVDTSGQAICAGDIVGIRAKYVYEVHYSYRGKQYDITLTLFRMLFDKIALRINPAKPEEAFLDDRTWLFPTLSICIGILVIVLARA